LESNTDVINEPKYPTAEAAPKFPVHPVTLTRWRLKGLIGYYRIGPRIYYGESHIREFLERCDRKPKTRCERKAKGVKEAA